MYSIFENLEKSVKRKKTLQTYHQNSGMIIRGPNILEVKKNHGSIAHKKT